MVRTAGSIRAQVEALAGREPAFARVVARLGTPEPRNSEPGAHSLLRTIAGPSAITSPAFTRSPTMTIGFWFMHVFWFERWNFTSV